MYLDLNIRGMDFFHDYTISKEAERLGYSDICFNYSPEDFNKKHMEYLNNNFDLNIHSGICLKDLKPNKLDKLSRKFKNSADLIAVHGGDSSLNRAACENIRVDILFRPYFKRHDCGINHVLAKEAHRNNVAIELSFVDILKTYHHRRAKMITNFKDIITLHRKFKFPLIISSYASSFYDLRRLNDIISVFKAIGLNEEEILKATNQVPIEILKFNENLDNLIVLGVEKL